MKHTLIILAAAAATVALGSCSVINSKKAPVPAVSEAAAIEATRAHDAQALAGHWYIASVDHITLTGYAADDDEWPFIEFVPAEGRFYGSNGCNVINGNFTVTVGQNLQLSDLAVTMRYCPDDTLGYRISSALDATRSFSLTNSENGDRILALHGANHRTVMTLKKSDISFLNGPWQVTAIGTTAVTDPEVRLVFDVPEGRLHGSTGCNLLNGELSRNPQLTNSVQFGNLATTRRMCPDLSTESALLIALEEVASARQDSPTAVTLHDASGHALITLTKLSKADF